jgi:hypothetical protein
MGAKPGPAGGLDVGAGAVGGPGNECMLLALEVRLDCEMAAFSSLAMTGLSASFLCSECGGVACGLRTT